MPLFAAAIMGASARLVYEGIYHLYPSTVIALVIALIVAVIVYFFAVLYLRVVTKEQLQEIPYGNKILKIARKMKLKL